MMITHKVPKNGRIKSKLYFVEFDDEPDPTGFCPRIERRSPDQSKAGAARYERNLRTQIREGTFRQKRKQAEAEKQRIAAMPLFSAFAEEFMLNYARLQNKPSEIASKQGILNRYLLPAFGLRRIDKIRPREIDNFKSQMISEKGLNPKTVNNALTVLSTMLTYAVDMEIIGALPKIKRLRTTEADFDFLTFEEAEQLLQAADYVPQKYEKKEWYVMIYLVLHAGLRIGELVELRRGDLYLGDEPGTSKLIVKRSYHSGHVDTPKSNKWREIPLTTSTVAILKKHQHLRSDLVFCTPRGERHIHRRCDQAIKRICKKAGLRDIGWHVLRHTFASHLMMRGARLKDIQELLGHADIKTTMRYAHLSPEMKQGTVALLEDPPPKCSRKNPESEPNNDVMAKLT